MSSNRQTGEARVLARLVAAYPGEVSALELAQISLQYSSRVHGLRAKGIEITTGLRSATARSAVFFDSSLGLPKQSSRPPTYSAKISRQIGPTANEPTPMVPVRRSRVASFNAGDVRGSARHSRPTSRGTVA
jgi:hypothetical protein